MSTELSPSGRFRLAVTCGGHWNSTGTITRVSDGKKIAVVKRNYSAFPALWVEGHPKGDFLLCGEDYQGHTVIDLNTGAVRSTLMEGYDKGHGFCMVEARYYSAWKIVVVSGCIWACPYEYRVYAFDDPMVSSQELKMESRPGKEDDAWAEHDPHWPELDGGVIKFFQTAREDDEDNTLCVGFPAAAVKVFKRDVNRLVFIREQVTPEEEEKRRRDDEARARFDAKIAAFKASDPLYLLYAELVAAKDSVLVPDNYESRGVTYGPGTVGGWCLHWAGYETRWCRRIMTAGRAIIDLEWAIRSGPIKLKIYLDGKTKEDKFFPHSVEGMREAFAYAEAQVKEARR
jgi:hypothetical protein